MAAKRQLLAELSCRRRVAPRSTSLATASMLSALVVGASSARASRSTKVRAANARGAACAAVESHRQQTAKNRSRGGHEAASRHLEAARGAHGAPPTCRSRAPVRKRPRSGGSKWSAGARSSTLASSGELEVATSVRTPSCISSELVRHPASTGTTIVSQKRPRNFALGHALSGAARHRADARAAGLTGSS